MIYSHDVLYIPVLIVGQILTPAMSFVPNTWEDNYKYKQLATFQICIHLQNCCDSENATPKLLLDTIVKL